MELYKKTGYLNDSFKIFHLIDEHMSDVEFHYHDFLKLMILIQGNVTYCIEGKYYKLKPYDIVLVNAGEIHKPFIESGETYERIILYISPELLNQHQTSTYDLAYCFKKAKQDQTSILRLESIKKSKLYQICEELERSYETKEYANELYNEILFLEFMIHLNRAAIHNHVTYPEDNYSNPKVLKIIHYINDHLKEDLSIDGIARTFYLNKHYLMHLFKSETGYTLGNYIANKRLLLAREMIQNGSSITNACYECGYKNYSSFSRAYKKQFKSIPKNLLE